MEGSNKLTTKSLLRKLGELYDSSPIISLERHQKWVIFSDLHMGDGGSTDDFKRNSELFIDAIEHYFLPNDFALVLNGDVEELQRFKLKKIQQTWSQVFELFDSFFEKSAFYKLVGNHDLELSVKQNHFNRYPIHEALRLQYENDMLFIFHGHQASKKYQQHNELIGFTLKYFANPLRIKSYSVAHSSRKQYKIEKRTYDFSTLKKIVSIIGHTHRPLFESLDKMERLKFQIEQLCRQYANSSTVDRHRIQNEIKLSSKELKRNFKENSGKDFQSYVYNSMFHVPSVFNAGCVVGKRGMTCLEIENDRIRLVHWFDKKMSKKYLVSSGYKIERQTNSDFYRLIINEESLAYVFARINFLA